MRPRSIVRRNHVVIIALIVSGCRALDCPPPEPSRSVVVWEPISGSQGRVSGVVIAARRGRPLTSAQVRRSPGDSVWRSVTPDGRFELRLTGSTGNTLEARARGYGAASAVVLPPLDSSIAATVVLSRSRASRRPAACGRVSTVAPDSIE